jgi:hypothetical protein
LARILSAETVYVDLDSDDGVARGSRPSLILGVYTLVAASYDATIESDSDSILDVGVCWP